MKGIAKGARALKGPPFATFWSGRLPALVYACLASFPAAGAALTLYSYEAAADVPHGVGLADAREIAPDASARDRYLVEDRPSPAAFADFFRYELIERTGACWIDADVVCVRPEALGDAPVIWGRQDDAEGADLINNAVLRLPPGDPVLGDLRAKARGAEGASLDWGALGPFALTQLAQARGRAETADPPSRFYPVRPDDFWRFFDPGSREAVAAAASEASLVHLWAELLRRTAYDFDAAPPRGSYLADLFAGLGVNAPFRRECPPEEIAALVRRWFASAPTPDGGT